MRLRERDENGNLKSEFVSIEDTLPVTLQRAIDEKKSEISAKVGAKIVSGYRSTLILASTGKAHLYGTTESDQLNMNAEYSGMIANTTQASVLFRTQDSLDFVTHTRDEFKQIAEAIKDRIKSYLSQGYAYYRQLMICQTIDDVNAIVVDVIDPQ